MNNSLTLEATEEESLSNATSEEDFWVSFESPRTQLPDLQRLPDLRTPAQQLDRQRLQQLLNSREDPANPQLEKSLHILRAAKRVEVRNASLLARNQAKKEMESTWYSMRSGYETDLKEVQSNYDDVKTMLYRRDKEIERFAKMLYDQEVLLTAQRLSAANQPPSRLLKSSEASELDDLRADNSRLRAQLEALKDMCKLYQDDAERATKQLTDAKDDLHKQRNDYEKVIRAIETKSVSREMELQGDREQTSREFEEFRREVEKELQVRELVAERQSKYIQALQEELKSAKIVIRSPRLKAKMMAKLKEFNVTVEDSEEYSSQYSKGSSTPRAANTPIRRPRGRFRKEFNHMDHQTYMKTASMDASIPSVESSRSYKQGSLFPYLLGDAQRTSNLS